MLRSFGPGKYDLLIDERVDALDPDQECGSVDENGMHHALINGEFVSDLDLEGLNDEEIEFLEAQVGAIISTNSDGFTSISYFEDADELAEAWRKIEESLEG